MTLAFQRLRAGSALPASYISVIRKRIDELEAKLAQADDLVRILEHLRWQEEDEQKTQSLS